MATIPPWLNISPGQFLQAMQAGASLGLQLAQQRGSNQPSPIRRGGGIPVRGGYSAPAAVAAPAAPIGDGFSADRLSYAVADDVGAMAGEAAAAEEARQGYNATLQNPFVDRTKYPEILSPAQRAEQKKMEIELLNKVREKKALSEAEPKKPDFRTVDNTVIRIDPVTGKATEVYSAPQSDNLRTVGSQLLRIGEDGKAKVIHTAPQRAGSALERLLGEDRKSVV